LLWEFVELDRHAGAVDAAVRLHGVGDVVERANHERIVPIAVEPDGAVVGREVHRDPFRLVPRRNDAADATVASVEFIRSVAVFKRTVCEWRTRQHDPFAGVEKNGGCHVIASLSSLASAGSWLSCACRISTQRRPNRRRPGLSHWRRLRIASTPASARMRSVNIGRSLMPLAPERNNSTANCPAVAARGALLPV